MAEVSTRLFKDTTPFLLGAISGFVLACVVISNGIISVGGEVREITMEAENPSERSKFKSVEEAAEPFQAPAKLEASRKTAGSPERGELTDAELVIPMSAANEDAKPILVAELAKLNGMVQGEGKPSIIALLDPLCPTCQELFSLYDRLAERMGVSIYWVPADATFQSLASREYSTYMIDLMSVGRHQEALALMRKIVEADYDVSAMPPIPSDWVASEDAEYALNRASIALGQLRAGTPLVVYNNDQGEISLMSGLPTEVELLGMKPVL